MVGLIYRILFKLMKIKVRGGLNFKGFPIICNCHGKMEIGKNVTINSSFLSNLIGMYQRTIIIARTRDAFVIIGDNVGMSGVTIYARKSIEIGDNVLIGANAKILDNDFHPLDIESRNIDKKEKILTKSVRIGKNCFIGCNCLILKGTVLGEGCVVGAGAVVSGIFPDNSVIVGNPGKVVKVIEQT